MASGTSQDSGAEHLQATDIPLYKYAPLPGRRSIRLLRFLLAEAEDAPVAIELLEFDLDNIPDDQEWIAVSYVWGEPATGAENVYCDGKRIPVTRNAAALLRRLAVIRKYDGEEGKPSLCWIDSVCIDQSSLDERGQQVALMGDIYSAAGLVMIWFDELNSQATLSLRLGEHVGNLDTWDLVDKDTLRAKFRENPFEMDSTFVFEPLKQQWFDRLWVVQEAVLARRSYILWPSATESVNFDVFSHGLRRLVLLLLQPDFTQDFFRYRLFSFVSYCRYALAAGTEDLLQHLPLRALAAGGERRNLDDRDKVYGVHSILARCGLEMPAPDYHEPVESIYTEISARLPQHQRSLRVLEYVVAGASKYPSLPSWCPDWSRGYGAEIYLINSDKEQDDAPAFLRDLPGQRAASAYRISDGGRTLTARGLPVGRVVDAFTLAPYGLGQMGDVTATRIREAALAWRRMLRVARRARPAPTPVWEAAEGLRAYVDGIHHDLFPWYEPASFNVWVRFVLSEPDERGQLVLPDVWPSPPPAGGDHDAPTTTAAMPALLVAAMLRQAFADAGPGLWPPDDEAVHCMRLSIAVANVISKLTRGTEPMMAVLDVLKVGFYVLSHRFTVPVTFFATAPEPDSGLVRAGSGSADADAAGQGERRQQGFVGVIRGDPERVLGSSLTLLEGCRMPVVLVPAEGASADGVGEAAVGGTAGGDEIGHTGRFELVGAALVHEVMKAEFWDEEKHPALIRGYSLV